MPLVSLSGGAQHNPRLPAYKKKNRELLKSQSQNRKAEHDQPIRIGASWHTVATQPFRRTGLKSWFGLQVWHNDWPRSFGPAPGLGCCRRQTDMEKKRVRHFQYLLQTRRQDLIGRGNHVNENSGPGQHDYDRDEGDRANGSQTQQLSSALSSQERLVLDAIERALRRVEQGTFGMCVACQREIGSKRLQAVPWALRCIHCQQKVECRAA